MALEELKRTNSNDFKISYCFPDSYFTYCLHEICWHTLSPSFWSRVELRHSCRTPPMFPKHFHSFSKTRSHHLHVSKVGKTFELSNLWKHFQFDFLHADFQLEWGLASFMGLCWQKQIEFQEFSTQLLTLQDVLLTYLQGKCIPIRVDNQLKKNEKAFIL